jgi:hypothetical protein
MNSPQFTRDSHYAPCVYLRNFANHNGQIFGYRTLVSHARVPLWKQKSPKGIGHWRHLYTRYAAGQETDEIETWLNRDFEEPAAEPLLKVTSGRSLTAKDWICLVRFLAAQMLRTPAYFAKNLPRWQASAPKLLESALQDSVRMLEAAKESGQTLEPSSFPNKEYLPIRVTSHIEPGQSTGQLKGSVVVGRGLWLFNMRHILGGAARVLHNHRWSILAPHDGLSWFSSDDPVIRLNYAANGSYDFNGGINRQHGEILFPLSPRHLMYTQIGGPRRPSRETLSCELTEAIRRMIAQHAFRMIFAVSPDENVPELRPRLVSPEQFRKERESQLNWHEDQTAAERDLMSATSS